MLESTEGGRARIRQGRENHVLLDREILERGGLRPATWNLDYKVLSNVAHLSTLSHLLMMATASSCSYLSATFIELFEATHKQRGFSTTGHAGVACRVALSKFHARILA
jgi:hypothetical protein